MNLSVGIVGLPNVGKSTLFNALLKKQQALAANYPFATIEPNIGVVPVPDERLQSLAEITQREDGMTHLPPIKNALIEFVDIAGLVKGASEGAGLGNKFLSHIREVKVVAHVVRAFEDADVIKEGAVDPKSDYETIVTELVLSDLQTLSKVNEKTLKADPAKKKLVDKLISEMNTGKAARNVVLEDEEKELIQDLQLLSSKPEVIILNVSEDQYSDVKNEETIKKYSEILGTSSEQLVVICAKVESELAELGIEDAKEYLKELGVEKSGLERLIQKAYSQLDLISYLTCGEVEVKAWTIKKGSNAVEAAGTIHTDFMNKFIKAEIVSYADFIEQNGWKNARTSGKARMEGRDYVMQDGDVTEFKIGR
ncbi:MAG: redox-regulated ATPase YchF [Candidatus Levybacteria bacterium]|nr:redox-regulated ATPase YchF [Candidatus Levybacteria bacterium]MBP9815397.1 redox-regulated ATPase YchF [Candidatus Levybacteria bacterium]